MKPDTAVVGFLDGGHWSACFGLSYRDLCLYDATHNRRIIREGGRELRSLCGSGGIPGGRNKVAASFLDDTDADWLFFIDTDMGFSADTVDRLVDCADPAERPVMGGLCFAGLRQRTDPPAPFYGERTVIRPTIFEWVETETEVGFNAILDYKRDEVFRVAATGAACLLIHRSALATMRGTFGDTWFNTFTHPSGIAGKPRTFSEDLSFCVRLQSVDLPVHVNTAVKTTHEKGSIFLDEQLYAAQQGWEV